jgi:hypothetical protein
VARRRYTNIPAVGSGCANSPRPSGEGNYDETRFGQDIMQRQNMVRAPGGTIQRQVFDVRNNNVETWVGTNDAGATDEAPDGVGAPGNNMQKTVTNIIDGGNPVGGDNLVTSIIHHIDDSTANDYQSDFFHDYRNRRTCTREWIKNTPGMPVKYLFTSQTLDNNSNVTQVQQFDSTMDTTDSTALVRQSNVFYDYLQRVYKTLRGGVNNLMAQYFFSEASGSTTADNSGNGNMGTLVGAAAWGTPGQGSSPHCLDTSAGGYVDCGEIPAAADGFRVSAWIKTTWDGSGPYAQQVIASHIAGTTWGDAGGWMLHIEYHDGQVLAAAAWADSGPSFNGPVVNDGQWHLVELGFVPATNTFTLYVDGTPASTYTPGTAFSESMAHLLISHRVDFTSLDDNFPGQISNVSVMHGTSDVLTGQTWYNPLNRAVKQAPEGAAAAYTKSTFDLANRPIGTYTGYCPTRVQSRRTRGNASVLRFSQKETGGS